MRKFILSFIILFILSYPVFAEEIPEAKLSELSSKFLQWQMEHQESHHVIGKNDSDDNVAFLNTGYIPDPIDFSHLIDNPPKLKNIFGKVGNALPASYDLRNENRLTNVKNQNPFGTCWTFAASGAMESNYLTQKLSKLGDNPDLSELHMAWFVYHDPEPGSSFTITTSQFGNGTLGLGGNSSMSTAYLSRLAGAVNESSLPYSTAGTNAKSAENILSEALSGKKPSDYYPRALRLLEKYDLGDVTSDNRDIIKQLIMQYGAVQISYYAGEGSVSSSGGSVAYFDNSQADYTDHAVLLVGWDDNFSVDNFANAKPSKNGAWLVRNSWGENWPNYNSDGYFYMSYEQYIGEGALYIVAEDDETLKHYGYDALGRTGYFSYKDVPTWSANIFQSERENEVLKEIGFYTVDNNVDYEIYIYTLGTEKPSSPIGTLVAQQSGTHVFSGYHSPLLLRQMQM